jgi:hypothetical protein
MPKVIGFSLTEENFPGADITTEEWEFLHAMERYQKTYSRRYPSWREAFRVLWCLGYRKSAPASKWPKKPTLNRAKPPLFPADAAEPVGS